MGNERKQTDLSKFNNRWYKPGGPVFLHIFWYLANAWFLKSWIPGSGWRVFLLQLYGAKIGRGVTIKPHVNIKYPWKLSVGDHCWIGENVWIDNLGNVEIGNNSCISQGALLLCGNHNYKKVSFDLMVGDITLEEGCWVGAKSLVTGGVIMHSHSVLSAGSVATSALDAYGIYAGNPATKVRERVIED